MSEKLRTIYREHRWLVQCTIFLWTLVVFAAAVFVIVRWNKSPGVGDRSRSPGSFVTAGEARALIESQPNFSKPKLVWLPQVLETEPNIREERRGARMLRRLIGPVTWENSAHFGDEEYVRLMPGTIALREVGLVTLSDSAEEEPISGRPSSWRHRIEIHLTNSGEQEAQAWEPDDINDDFEGEGETVEGDFVTTSVRKKYAGGWLVPTAKRQVGSIVSVRPAMLEGKPLAGVVEVEFTWRWQPTVAGAAFDKANPARANYTEAVQKFIKLLENEFDSRAISRGMASFQFKDGHWSVLENEGEPLLFLEW